MLELFYSETCPYCQKVINYFKSTGIDFIPKNINIGENYDTLIKRGGIAQVPFLVDKKNDKQLYESVEIISYVQNIIK